MATGVITWGQRWWGKLRQPRHLHLQGYWLFASAVGLGMTTDLLGWLYERTYILQGIQFSWRWLALPSVYVPLLLGYWLSHSQGHQPQHPLRRGAMALMMGVWVMVILSQIIQGIVIAERAVYDPSNIAQFARLGQSKTVPETYTLPPRRAISALALATGTTTGSGGCLRISGQMGKLRDATPERVSPVNLARWYRGGFSPRSLGPWGTSFFPLRIPL